MARPVYSTRFAAMQAVTGGPFLAYAVPAGFVAVVKCFTIVSGDTHISGLDARFTLNSGGPALALRALGAGPAGTPGDTALFFGDWVLNAGESLFVFVDAGTADMYASGYKLSLP